MARIHSLRLLAALASVVTLLGLGPATALAGRANGGLPGAPASNPLAGMRWGIYTGAYDGVYSAYSGAGGTARRLLSQIALRPSVHWFGAWYGDGDAGNAVRQYIDNVTGGDPNVLTQIAVFRLDPWEGQACSTAPGPGRAGSYRRWIDSFAGGIGSSRTVIVLQPDLPFALCSPGEMTWLHMVGYAARRLSALPHTTVYVDAGAAYWPRLSQAAWMLQQAGIRYARGFALNDTEYDSTSNELMLGAQIVGRLAAIGLPGKHFVINTAENGSPFLNGQYPGNPENPRVCRNPQDRLCASLGIPPTWHTADHRWGLGPVARGVAARYADAYLWVGRPWLVEGSGPFDLGRALGLIKASPF